MKIKNIKKFIRSILLVLAIALVVIILISKASYSNKEIEYKKICVSEGDTLWNISKSIQNSNDYYSGRDIRYIINDIMKINNLENSNIFTNQELLIPTI